jgi:hypothetical protein
MAMMPCSARGVSAVIASIAFGLSACSDLTPTLRLNPHLQSVGKDVAERDIAECKQKAEGKGYKARTASAVGGLTNGTSGSGDLMAGGIAGVVELHWRDSVQSNLPRNTQIMSTAA